MGTIQEMYDSWCIEEIRGNTQVNKRVWLAWFNKGLLIFQKSILEYVSGKVSSSVAYTDIEKDKDQYRLPEYDSINNVNDFYSIVQLRVAYHTDKNGNPIYRVCEPINFGDYNISPALNKWETTSQGEEVLKARGGTQRGEPMVRDRISERSPKYIFVPKYQNGTYHNEIKIFPTPTENVDRGLTLTYNFIQRPISYSDAFPTSGTSIDLGKLNLPWYFFDAIEDYITFRLYQAENPEMAQHYYQQFEQTLNDNIYGLNKDKRPVDESFADLRYFYHY